MSLSYAKCPVGNLHTGEILSLVCVDSKCQKRGLICPICRMNYHEDHEILPLKIFIDHVKKSFLQSEDCESLNNLSDYLRSIENSKKELLNILKETAENIAIQLKKVEDKIQENFASIRRNILSQSTMSTKLPMFIETLLSKQENDPYVLQEEFKKYSELIKFDKTKIQISDKSKKLVEEYSETPKQLQLSVREQIEKLKLGLEDLFAEKATKPMKKQEGYTFSLEKKHHSMNITDDKKQVYSAEVVEEFGVAYIKDETSDAVKKIAFKIISASSGNIVLGMGKPDQDKEIAFIYSGSPVPNQHFSINSDGYCENQASSEEVSQSQTSFNFHEAGVDVSIHYELAKNLITFTKLNSGQTKCLSINGLLEDDKKKLCFFVSLGQGDSVRIIDSEK